MTEYFAQTPQLRCPVHLGSEWLVLLLLQTFLKCLFFAVHLLEFFIPLAAKIVMFGNLCFLQLSY